MSSPFMIKPVHSGITLTYYCDSLRGTLVIYDSNNLYMNMYNVDDKSTVITLANWYHAKAKTGLSLVETELFHIFAGQCYSYIVCQYNLLHL
uniref:Uncharacterized protein n=1 Tax=Moniliophthora roreri TaxID=221103 RepID=A0A0W0FD33_MONRR